MIARGQDSEVYEYGDRVYKFILPTAEESHFRLLAEVKKNHGLSCLPKIDDSGVLAELLVGDTTMYVGFAITERLQGWDLRDDISDSVSLRPDPDVDSLPVESPESGTVEKEYSVRDQDGFNWLHGKKPPRKDGAATVGDLKRSKPKFVEYLYSIGSSMLYRYHMRSGSEAVLRSACPELWGRLDDFRNSARKIPGFFVSDLGDTNIMKDDSGTLKIVDFGTHYETTHVGSSPSVYKR